MAWPILVEGRPRLWLASALASATFVIVCTGVPSQAIYHTPTKGGVRHLPDDLSAFRDVWQKAHPGKPFYVAVDGGHYWPLPYYLRAFQVGYGDFDGAERAPVRFLVAHDSSTPVIPGYRVFSLHLRRNESYWVLVDVTNKVDIPFMFGEW